MSVIVVRMKLDVINVVIAACLAIAGLLVIVQLFTAPTPVDAPQPLPAGVSAVQ